MEGVGNKGERISVRPKYAYNELLLPGKAVYASPENLEKYKEAMSNVSKAEHSSPTASLVISDCYAFMKNFILYQQFFAYRQ